ncbi:hypothetical protein D3C87_1231160 [compost metagenome]
MRLALKPTMVSAVQRPTHAGNSVNRLSEQNNTRKRVRRCRSSGRLLKALPLRLSTSRESARSKISRGNSVRPQLRSRRVMPASVPARSCARVCMKGFAVDRVNGRHDSGKGRLPVRLAPELPPIAPTGCAYAPGQSRHRPGFHATSVGRAGSGACPDRTERPPD